MKEIKIIPIIILGLALCACGNANSENANKVDVSEGEKASLVLDTEKKIKPIVKTKMWILNK